MATMIYKKVVMIISPTFDCVELIGNHYFHAVE